MNNKGLQKPLIFKKEKKRKKKRRERKKKIIFDKSFDKFL